MMVNVVVKTSIAPRIISGKAQLGAVSASINISPTKSKEIATRKFIDKKKMYHPALFFDIFAIRIIAFIINFLNI